MYIVINGGGKVGEYLATKMLDQGNEVAVIERDESNADRLSGILEGSYIVIQGDGCISRYQSDAEVERADVFVSTTGQDDSNLMACEIANRVFHVPRVIARVNSPKNIRIFRKMGIECVSSTALIATIIEQDATLGGLSALSDLAHGDVALEETTVPTMTHHDNDEGVLATDIEMPDGCLIVAVSDSENPHDMEVVSESTILMPGDLVVIACDTDKTDDAIRVIRSL